jgi:hypothetical protein
MEGTGAPQLGHLTMFPAFSFSGPDAGAAPPAGVPQDGQNFTPSPICVPQFAQKAISFSFAALAAYMFFQPLLFRPNGAQKPSLIGVPQTSCPLDTAALRRRFYPITYYYISFTLFSWTTKPGHRPNLYIHLSPLRTLRPRWALMTVMTLWVVTVCWRQLSPLSNTASGVCF